MHARATGPVIVALALVAASLVPPPADAAHPDPNHAPTPLVSDVAVQAGIAQVTQTSGAAVADLTGDGALDFALIRHGEQDGLIYDNDGTGRFAVRQGVRFPATGDPHDCAWADVDADGALDLYCTGGASGGYRRNPNKLWMQRSDGTFVDRAAAYGVTDDAGRGRFTAFFDANGDGRPDLFVGNECCRPDAVPSPNRLFLNRDGSSFEPAPAFGLDTEIGNRCVRPADLDADGWTDLVVCGNRANGIRIYRNLGGTGFADVAAEWGLAGLNATDALVVDMTADGIPDVVAIGGDRYQSSPLRVFPGLRGGGFGAPIYTLGLHAGARLAAGDVNGDTLPDLYVMQGSVLTSNPQDLVLVNTAAGRRFASLPIPHETQGRGDGVVAFDHDGNGLTDFLVMNGCCSTPGPLNLIAFYPGDTWLRSFVVDSATDLPDGDPADGACVTAEATCTLRAAMMQAAALGGPDRIAFAGPMRVRPETGLPPITDPVMIDAGEHAVTLDASGLSEGPALRLEAHAFLRAIALEASPGDGIHIRSHARARLDGVRVDGSRGVGIQVAAALGVQIERGAVRGNALGGVVVAPGAGTTTLRATTFDGNGGPAIDLGGDGPTPNDEGDADQGPNGLLNHPEVDAAFAARVPRLAMTMRGAPWSVATLEVFSSPACHVSGRGEGARWLGSTQVRLDASGVARTTITPTRAIAAGEVLTATATDEHGATSEFSPCAAVGEVTPEPPVVLDAAADAFVDPARPGSNFGGWGVLRTGPGSSGMRSYLRFDARGLTRTVSRATLRLYATRALPEGLSLSPLVPGMWQEATITHSNAPTPNGDLLTTGPVQRDSWIEMDVTTLLRDRMLDIVLPAGPSTGFFRSREASENRPALFVELAEPQPVVLPIADATADHAAPDTAAGSWISMQARGGDTPATGFIAFDLTGLDAPPARAVLWLYPTRSVPAGISVRAAGDASWNEMSVTARSAPVATGGAIASGPLRLNTWAGIDVTALVRTDRAFTLSLSAEPGSHAYLRARESGTTAPYLLLE